MYVARIGYIYMYPPSTLYLWLKLFLCRNPAVGKVQYSDLFFRLHDIHHTLNYTQCTLSISYLNTQNWRVLLIFTVKRFVSVAKIMYLLKRKGRLSIDLFLYFYLPFRRYWYKRREEIKTLSVGFRFKICDTDLKVERKFKTLFREYVSQLYRSNILAF